MLESVGKTLEQARLQKKLSVEEVAFATKIRADRILDMEKDDFRNFPNLTYAKSFLTLYAKFLGVNIAEYTASLGKANPVGVSDYEYLSHDSAAHVPKPESRTGRPIGSLFFIVLLLILGVLSFYLFIGYQRLGRGVATEPIPTPTPEAVAPSPTPAPVEPTPVLEPAPTPVPAEQALAPVQDGTVEVRRAQPAQPIQTPTPVPEFELLVEPLRKTSLRIQKDDPQAAPVFDGLVNSKTGALKFQGARFWVSVGDKKAVKISRGGVAVEEGDPLVVVQ